MAKQEMTSQVECLRTLKEKGYSKDFLIKNGQLYFEKSAQKYNPNQVKIETYYRFEGESDPSDSSILYAIVTEDGNKGTVTNAYGPYADTDTGKFISQVEEISKQTSAKID